MIRVIIPVSSQQQNALLQLLFTTGPVSMRRLVMQCTGRQEERSLDSSVHHLWQRGLIRLDAQGRLLCTDEGRRRVAWLNSPCGRQLVMAEQLLRICGRLNGDVAEAASKMIAGGWDRRTIELALHWRRDPLLRVPPNANLHAG